MKMLSKVIAQANVDHVEKWFDMSVEWIFQVFGELEFRDVSTSHIMEAIKKLGIEIPGQVGKEADNAYNEGVTEFL